MPSSSTLRQLLAFAIGLCFGLGLTSGCKPKTAVTDQRNGDPSVLASSVSSLGTGLPSGNGETSADPSGAPSGSGEPSTFNDVLPGPVTGSAVALTLSGPTSVAVGACSAVFLVTSVDGQGHPLLASPTDDTAVGIGGRGSAALFLEETCTTPLTEPVIGSESSSMSFFLKDGVAEILALNVTASGAGVTLNPTSVSVIIH
jgi:hypothetical protein